MDPIRAGDAVVLTLPEAESPGIVEAVATWQWNRFRTKDTHWLDIVVPSGMVDWTVVGQLAGPTSDTDCDRIAQAVIKREHANRPRGPVSDLPGLIDIGDVHRVMRRP